MANAVLAHTNRYRAATLSGGNWNNSYPLANSQDRLLNHYCQSINALSSSTIIIADLGAAYPIGAVGLERHNITTSGTIQFHLSNASNFTTTVFNTGALPVYAGRTFGYYLGQEYTARYCKISIVDTTNPEGVIRLALGFLGRAFQPYENIAWGAEQGFRVKSKVTEMENGDRFTRKYNAKRWYNLNLEYLTHDEIYNTVLPMLESQDVTEEYLFFEDPQGLYPSQQIFFMTADEVGGSRYTSWQTHDASLRLTQL